MRTLGICLIIMMALSISVSANRPAARAAVEDIACMNRAGGPGVQHVDMPLPIALGKFCDKVQIFVTVKVLGGDARDQNQVEAAMAHELQDLAEACNFTRESGAKPCRYIEFPVRLDKSVGDSTFRTNHSESDEWTDQSRRYGSNSRSDSSSCNSSTESTYVASSVSGGLDLHQANGSITGLGFIDDAFSANSEITASSEQRSTFSRNYSHSNRYGNYGSRHSTTDGSSFDASQEYSARQSSRVTAKEACHKLAVCALAKAIDYYNKNCCLTIVIPKEVEGPQVMYTGNPADIK